MTNAGGATGSKADDPANKPIDHAAGNEHKEADKPAEKMKELFSVLTGDGGEPVEAPADRHHACLPDDGAGLHQGRRVRGP